MFDNFLRDFDIAPFREMEERLGSFESCSNISETSKQIKVNAELPGMEEKDISVTIEDDTSSSRVKGKMKKEEDEEQYHREISYGTFRRFIPLSAKIDIDKVEAKFNKGVLKITLPKVPGLEGVKGKKIEIKSK
ncbi:MAG: Hsp20/alpha crystallin family protein [Desulfobulbaceae bacterium]|nr:Hsp20/alpha crystallin family protein [Desulfobulbaceae bacterium]